MSAEQLSSIAGVVLSLFLAYIPGVSGWYDGKDAKQKAGIMALLLFVVSGVVYGLACAGLAADLNLGVTCDQASLLGLIKVLVAALISNQGTFLLAVRAFKK